jgi:hypothetical protein
MVEQSKRGGGEDGSGAVRPSATLDLDRERPCLGLHRVSMSVREGKAVLDTGLDTCSHSCFQVIGGLLQHTGYGSRAWTNLERRARIEPAENMRMKRERITKRDRSGRSRRELSSHQLCRGSPSLIKRDRPLRSRTLFLDTPSRFRHRASRPTVGQPPTSDRS